MEKRELLYTGKAKSVYKTDDDNHYIMEFRNDASAFDGKKRAQLERKGLVNNQFNAFIMAKLSEGGVVSDHVELLTPNESIVKKLDMFPVECVVRNVAAGSMCRRLGIEEGTDLMPPTFEFFLKDDALGDPMINEYHIQSFGWATKAQIEEMKALTFKVNNILSPLFADAGMILVDYKLEFGLDVNGVMTLGDEFTPDGCRLWDKETRQKMDKDRFRQDLGDVIQTYEVVGARLGVEFKDSI